MLSDQKSRREVDKKLQVKFDGQRFSGNDFFARKSKVRQDFESAFQYKKESANSYQEEIFVDMENFFPSYKENSKCRLIRHQGGRLASQCNNHIRRDGVRSREIRIGQKEDSMRRVRRIPLSQGNSANAMLDLLRQRCHCNQERSIYRRGRLFQM